MTEEVLPNIYRMEIPLPKNPLRAVNAYVLKGKSRHLIVDTGLNRQECRDAFTAGLQHLGVSLENADFFITHHHADHSALACRLASGTSTLFLSGPDAEWITRRTRWEQMADHARLHGFPEEVLQAAIRSHPAHQYGPQVQVPPTILQEGDLLRSGRYTFECVATPGHTPGHTCLYEPQKKVLLSGDHVLVDITPNIQSWSDDGHPLRDYLASLEKVGRMDVEVVLPGHRRVFTDCRRRIQELIRHHHRRADEVFEILRKGSRNAFAVAAEMSWDIHFSSWSRFPPAQKWFATGEALAHLKYLQEEGRVFREVRDGGVVFGLSTR
jgi:glyoxylase-like metal-dependent hydrolase (beta-lactamase superfamily II)